MMDWDGESDAEVAATAADARSETAASRLPLGDPQRLGALLARLAPRMASVALGVTRDPEAARDVVQNAFEKVLRHGDAFRGEARVSTWMHRIVTNEALMWRRGQRRRREEQPESAHGGVAFAVDAAPGPAELLELRQLRERLGRGLRQLSRDEHDLVRCCALEGQSYADYGRRHGLHPAAVKSRAFRARRHLARLLDAPAPGPRRPPRRASAEPRSDT